MAGRVIRSGRTTSRRRTRLPLEDGARIAVVGGGPAGSFFSIFALKMAEAAGLRIAIDVYEPKDFRAQGPAGCNMCGGIVSESLVQHLAAEGIVLPPEVVQRGIDSYVLHTDEGEARIATPSREKAIGAVHRGAGPRSADGARYESFDAYLLTVATLLGARVVRRRVERVTRVAGRPAIPGEDGAEVPYDLLVVASGANAPPRYLDGLGLPPGEAITTKTAIREYRVGRPVIRRTLGDSMHVFLLHLARLEFAAFVPKGEYVTLCLLGEAIDQPLLDAFLADPQVAGSMPAGWQSADHACKCAPKMNVGWRGRPYTDRVVRVGDAGVARLYKDGIGSAYRTAKAAAAAAVFEGVSEEDFRLRYGPACRAIEADNALGRLVFASVRFFQAFRFARRALIAVVAGEQRDRRRPARMSAVLWDTFTGSAPYREILVRALHPALLWRLARALLVAALGGGRGRARPAAPGLETATG